MKKFFLIVIYILLTTFSPSIADESASGNITPPLLTPQEDDFVLGEDSAKNIVIDYSSLACPHCGTFYSSIFPKLEKKYILTGKIKFIHRDFPLDKVSFDASKLLNCHSDKYYPLLKILYNRQHAWAYHKNYLEYLANIFQIAGLSKSRFDQCLSDKDIENKILTNQLKATQALDINGTPTVFVNGKKYDGPHDYYNFSQFLDKELNG